MTEGGKSEEKKGGEADDKSECSLCQVCLVKKDKLSRVKIRYLHL